jgi:hypothetical protein
VNRIEAKVGRQGLGVLQGVKAIICGMGGRGIYGGAKLPHQYEVVDVTGLQTGVLAVVHECQQFLDILGQALELLQRLHD